ncbi:unnamed protein product [Calicophoron daubneyi]|uniref:Trematode PH-like domain-containing protein n=1 Tax=Calicophoron daubneyi TaxID=300641 RepID=A0AAV2TJ19_CALDB
MTKRQSRSRNSRATNGEYANTDAGQNVYQRIQTCPCYRKKLREGEEFKESEARQVMDNARKKRQSHATANMMEDKFTLVRTKPRGKEPFRTWLGYSEIANIQRSQKMGNFFVLSVDSANSRNRYYEVYKCKTDADAQAFENIVRQAKQDPEGKVRGEPIGKESPKVNLSRQRTISHLEFQTLLDSSDEENRGNSVYELLSPTPPEEYDYEDKEPLSPAVQNKYKENYVRSAPAQSPSPPVARAPSPVFRAPSPVFRAPSPVVRAPSPVVRAPSPEVRAPPPIVRTSLPTHIVTTGEPTREVAVKAPPPPKPRGSEGLTYIEFDSRTQNPSVGDNGPVYMFMCRQDAELSEDGHEDSYATRTGCGESRPSHQNNQDMRSAGQVLYEYAR